MPTEPNVSIYAKLTFHALFDGFEKLKLDSVGTFMFFGVSEVLQEGVISGRDILRFKRLCKDVILEENDRFLFTRNASPLLISLTTLLEADDPPAPKSKAPSCRSEWYLNALGSFFDVYENRYAQREPVANFLANWLEQYLICVGNDPDRSVFVSRFKEAFEPLNKRYRSPVRFKAAKVAPAQLALPLPEPVATPIPEPKPSLVTDTTRVPSVWDQIHGSEFRIITEEEADIMADYQSPLSPPVQDVLSSVSIIRAPDKTEQEIFLDKIAVQHLLVNSPITLEAEINPLTEEPHNWRDYADIYTRWPSIGIVGDYLIFSAINFRDSDLEGSKVYLGGQIQINGGTPLSQGSLEKILNIEAQTNPKPRCLVSRIRLQAGLTGKTWVNTEGLGDTENSKRWFIVARRDATNLPAGLKKPYDFNREWGIWLVPEFVHNMYAAQLKKEVGLRP